MSGTTIVLGRSPSSHIVIADETVSSRHAELSLSGDGRLLVIDCRSTNGTFDVTDGQKKVIRQGTFGAGA